MKKHITKPSNAQTKTQNTDDDLQKSEVAASRFLDRFGKDFQSPSFEIQNAQIAIAFTRYMLIAIEQRESEDYRSCGELFMWFYQELQDSINYFPSYKPHEIRPTSLLMYGKDEYQYPLTLIYLQYKTKPPSLQSKPIRW